MDISRRKLLVLASLLVKKKKRKARRYQVHPINKNRESRGDWNNLVTELRLDSNRFQNYFRMSDELFDRLVSILGPSLQKNVYYRKDIIPVGASVAITLRFLASGDSQVSLSYAYRIGKATVSSIIRKVCEAIWEKLSDVFMKPTTDNWLHIASEMENIWNFPHCIGAIDGKHVLIQAPSNSGSEYFNYKHSHSIVLLAIVDHNYRFIMVDIGASGRQSDGGVFKNSEIGKGFENNLFNLPHVKPLSKDGSANTVPYVLVGDEAFQLTEYLMRPYPGRGGLDIEKKVNNYRLSRCRRLVENSFGIMVSRFRLFRKPIIAIVDNVMKYLQATTCLHNYIINETERLHQLHCYIPPLYVDSEAEDGTLIRGEWRNELDPISFRNINGTTLGSNRSSLHAAQIREQFTNYFLSDEGSISWQWDNI